MSQKSVSGARSSSGLGWTRLLVDGTDVISLSGDLDLVTIADLRPRLMGVAESSTAGTIVLDMHDVTFVDATTIGVIVAAWDVARSRGRRLVVDRLRGTPALAFEKLDLRPILTLPAEAGDRGRSAGDRGSAGAARRRALVGGADSAR